MGRLFGTDGVRGIANTELDAKLAFELGRAGAYVLAGETHHTPRILIGKDTRRSGDMLEMALIAGICSAGATAIRAGIIPTPAVAHLVRAYGCDAGVVISASHNPAEFNGIKFFNAEGYKLSDAIEAHIEGILLDGTDEISKPIGSGVGVVTENSSAGDDYVQFAIGTVGEPLIGLKVAIDCANGAAYEVASAALEQLGVETVVINNTPDGMNINRDCGSTHMKQLQEMTVSHGCDVGLAFDGDADRVLAVDENGEIVDGDKMMAVIGLALMQKGKLEKNTIVATVMSNLGLDIMAREQGLTLVKTKVGDRYVLEKMVQDGFVLGGEQSGHVIIKTYNTTGDGLVTGLQLLKVMKDSGKKLSELAGVLQVLPQVLKNAKVTNGKKHTYMQHPDIAEKCRQLEEIFHGDGRVLIRPSGTEPLVRVMIEGRDLVYITEKAEELAGILEQWGRE